LLYQRGVNISALEQSPTTLPGAQNHDYYSVSQEDVRYYASKGFSLVRIPILWERLQPTLWGPFDATYKGYIDQAISYAATYRMSVILDLHNYGGRLVDGSTKKVTSGELPLSAFADFWTRAAEAWKGVDTVWAFDTMNEPGSMPYASGPSNGNFTSSTSQLHRAAIAAIRGAGARQWIILETDEYSGLQNFVAYYGANPQVWWEDPLNRTMVSGHYYFDADHTGQYRQHWQPGLRSRIRSEVVPFLDWSKRRGIPALIGEYGVPTRVGAFGIIDSADVSAWQMDLDTFLGILDEYQVSAAYWSGSVHLLDQLSLEPSDPRSMAVDYTAEKSTTRVVAAHGPRLGDAC
jgi:endoglucanase